MDPRVPIDDDEALYRAILAKVQRPLRYIGGEWNEVVKDHRSVDLTFALAFPDVYEIGMSHLGFRILYSLLNSREDTAAERVFCPWPDMADTLRRHRRPLGTLETGTPLGRLDVVGFSLQYEMTFTNVLEMLDLAGIPVRSDQRDDSHPLVLAGGPVVFNVEPIADFLDLVFVGDGEEMVPEFLDRLARLKRSGAGREEKIRELAAIEGIYAPSLYGLEREDGNGLMIPVPRDDAPYPVRRRILLDLDQVPFPDRIIVPHGEIVHDRVSVELMRGCPVGCRFCQAGYVYRPTRERHPNDVRDTVIRSVRATGYDAFSLSSLNTGEYGSIHPLLFDLMERFEPERVSVSLGSMHASTMTEELAREVRRVRKSGFTIAPEAGSQRLRNVINKNLDESQILDACRLAFEAGWQQIKLYFMIGLPTETDEDVDAQADLARKILEIGRCARKKGRVEVTLSASSFVPKPVTPFQWIGMDRRENLYRKQDRIADRVRRGIRFKHHECETSYLEAVFSRGDRRLGPVLERAWRNGARFDGWAEHFALDAWKEAFRVEGVDPDRYAHGDWDPGCRLPWDVVDSRVNKKWLALDLARALDEGTLTVCGPTDCHGCAAFARDCVEGVVAETTGRKMGAEAAPGRPAPSPDGPRYRYRVRLEKTGRMRFLGHLDLARSVQRGMRRAGIPLIYSQGFNPKPKVAFGPALPVGTASEGEYLDFETDRRLEAGDTLDAVNGFLPAGIRFLAMREIQRTTPSLSEAIRAARYRVRTPDDTDLDARIESYRARSGVTVTRVRKGKRTVFDLHREVLGLERTEDGELRLVLAMGGGSSVKPEEVLGEVLGEVDSGVTIVREDLLVDFQGRQVNPLLAASANSHVQRTVR